MSVRERVWRDVETGEQRSAWQVDFVFEHADGRKERIRKTSPVNTKRGAEKYERQRRRAMLDADGGGRPGASEAAAVPVPPPPPTMREFAPRFIEYSTNNNRPSTVATKEQYLEEHLLPAFGDRRLNEIRFADVEAFKAAMRSKLAQSRHRKEAPTKWAIKKRYGPLPNTLRDKTINNILSCLRKLLNVAVEYEVLAGAPKVKLFKTIPPPFDFLDFEEAERLLKAADPEWKPILQLALKSGLRQGEILGLEWNDVDLIRGRINVRRSIWKGLEGPPKGGRARAVEVPASVVKSLETMRRGGPYVFCNEDGGRLSKGALKRPLVRALRGSGISRENGKIGWHDLRHTYASHLAMRGVSLKIIQELLGHTTLELTLRYAHLSPDVKQQAVQILDEAPPKGPEVVPPLVERVGDEWVFSDP
jgi:integrase